MATAVNVSLRECKLVIERVLWVANRPRGRVPAIRDTILLREALNHDGLRTLCEDYEHMADVRDRRMSCAVDAGQVVVDGHGEHGFVAVPDIVDLTAALVQRFGRIELSCRNVITPELMALCESLLPGYGVTCERHKADFTSDFVCTATRSAPLHTDDNRTELAGQNPHNAAAASATAGGSVSVIAQHTNEILEDGTDIASDVWWRLWEIACQALTPDSPSSRTHTGRSVFDDKGGIVGELGEDLEHCACSGAS